MRYTFEIALNYVTISCYKVKIVRYKLALARESHSSPSELDFITQFCLYLSSEKKAKIVRKKVRIARGKLAIARKSLFLTICKLISHNSEKKVRIARRKLSIVWKKEMRDKKSQLPSFYFYSEMEMGFHI